MSRAAKSTGKRKRAGSAQGESGGGNGAGNGRSGDIFQELLRVFDAPDIEQQVGLFRFPVDTTAEPDYLSEVEQPMDLSTIRAKLEDGEYESPAEMSRDVELMFANARKYNKTRHPWVVKIADDLKKRYNANKATVLSRAASAATPAPVAAARTKAAAKPAARHGAKANGAAKQVPAAQWVPKGSAILENLRKRDKSKVFEVPVDPVMLPVYPHIVPHPISFSEIAAKLQKQVYKNHFQFARDVRRVFGNALRFNTVPGDAIRQLARDMQWAFESQWTHHFDDALFPGAQIVLDCVDDILQQEGIYSFSNPVESYYENKKLPHHYSRYAEKPMCLGDIVSKTCEGEYQGFDQVRDDIHRIFENCRRYYTAVEPTSGFITLARRFEDEMMAYLDRRQVEIVQTPAPAAKPGRAPASAPAKAAGAKAGPAKVTPTKAAAEPVVASTTTPKAAAQAKMKDKYSWILDRLLKHKFKAERTGIWIHTAKPFEAAIDPTSDLGREYYAIIKNPIDLSMIRKNIQKGKYNSADGFRDDMKLLEANCKEFNIGEAGLEIRIIVERLISVFESLLRHVLREIWASRDEGLKRAAGLLQQSLVDFMNETDSPADREYVEHVTQPKPKPVSQQKKHHHNHHEVKPAASAKAEAPLTVNLASLKRMSSATAHEAPASAPADESFEFDPHQLDDDMSAHPYVEPSSRAPPTKSRKKGKRKDSHEPPAPAPIPVRAPVAAPPAQRPAWHENAQRALSKLKRHDYVNPQGTKRATDWFTPVLQLFPEEQFKQDYEYVIKRPMDLGTIEWNLQNDSILDVSQFYEDICLVFENAITYNEPHTDDDAAVYLVKAATIILQFWKELALEILPLLDDAKYDDEQKAQLGDLRYSRQAESRQERLAFVRPQKIVYLRHGRKSIEELLKRLFTTKQQRDELRVFFNEPVNTKEVPNYLVHVADPMDMGTIHKKLDAEQYETYGDFLVDVELVFNNAKAFNGVFRATDEWSDKVYQAAEALEERYNHALNEEFTVSAADFCRRWSQIEQFVHQQEIARQEQEEEEARIAEEQRNKAEYEERIRRGREREDRRHEANRNARQAADADADYVDGDIPIDDHPPPELDATLLRVPKEQLARAPVQKETHTSLRADVFTRARSLWASVPSTPVVSAPVPLSLTPEISALEKLASSHDSTEQLEIAMAMDAPAHDDTTRITTEEGEISQGLPADLHASSRVILEATGSWESVGEAATGDKSSKNTKRNAQFQLLRQVRAKIESVLPEFTEDRAHAVRGKGKGKGKGMSFELPSVAVWDKRAVWKSNEVPIETEEHKNEIELAADSGLRIALLDTQHSTWRGPAGCVVASPCKLSNVVGNPWFGHVMKVFVPVDIVGTNACTAEALSWTGTRQGSINVRVGAAQLTFTSTLSQVNAASDDRSNKQQLRQPREVADGNRFQVQVPFHLFGEEMDTVVESSMKFPFEDLSKLGSAGAGCPALQLLSDFGEHNLNLADRTVEAVENFYSGQAECSSTPTKPIPFVHLADGLFLLEEIEKQTVQLGAAWSADCLVLTFIWRGVGSAVRTGFLQRQVTTTLSHAPQQTSTEQQQRQQRTLQPARSFESWPALSNKEVRIPTVPGSGWRKPQTYRNPARRVLPPPGLQDVFASEVDPEL